jgi:hypothetical protein
MTSHLARRIRSAELICYPVGSFYSSLIANLLPAGVGRAVAASPGCKVYVPNLGQDPELFGHDIRRQVEQLLRPLLADAPDAEPRHMLHAVLVDDAHTGYAGGIPEAWLAGQGIRVIRMPLVTAKEPPLADARRLCRALLCIAGSHMDD